MSSLLDTGSHIKTVALTDFMLVAMSSTGGLHLWSTLQLMANTSGSDEQDNQRRLNPMPPTAVSLPNQQTFWRSLAVSNTKIVFGIEAKLGDLMVFSFTAETKGMITPDSPEREAAARGNPKRKRTKKCTNSCCNYTPEFDAAGADLK